MISYKENWSFVRLGDFADYEKGKKPKFSSKYLDNGYKYPYVDIVAFEKGIIREYVNAEKCVLCGDNDLLMVWDGSRSGYVGKSIKGVVGSTLMRLRFPDIDNGYAYYYLRSKFHEINKRVKGTGTPHVDPTLLWNYELPIPPLPEQRAIVAKIEQLFSELDNGIANLKKAQEQLKVYRQAVLKQAFEGELTRGWRASQLHLPSADELLDRIARERESSAKAQGKKLKPVKPISKEELAALPVLPDGWSWVTLGNFTLGVEYGTSTKSQEIGRVPVLRMGNIQNGKIDWDDLVFTDNEEEITKYQLREGDVLFNRTNSPELVGKTAIYTGDREAIYAGYLIRINQINSLLESRFLNYFLNSCFAKVFSDTVKTDGVNQSNINGEKLKSYPFPFCSPAEQAQVVQEIETRFSVCDNLESAIRESLEKAEALRQSILKKAFEGSLLSEAELDETRRAPDWEPAEKLLERIRKERKVI